MGRPTCSVCPATPENEVEAEALWEQALVEAGATPDRAARTVGEGRMAQAIARDDVRVYLARTAQRYVGFVVLTHSQLSGLNCNTGVWIDQLYVAPHARRRGVAKALLAAAARHAEQVGAGQVVSTVPAQGREANRFFARLGFGTHLVYRVTSTSALRRRLAGEADSSLGLVEQVLQRRRFLRTRAIADLPGEAECPVTPPAPSVEQSACGLDGALAGPVPTLVARPAR